MDIELTKVTMQQFEDMVKNKDNILQALSAEGDFMRLFYSTRVHGYIPLLKTSIPGQEKTSKEKSSEGNR